RSVPPKMPPPLVTARVKQPGDAAGVRVNSGQVRSLVAVAQEAGQGEVPRPGRAPVADSDDMVNFKEDGIALLGHPAVFAAGMGPFPDQLFQGAVHGATSLSRFRSGRPAARHGPSTSLWRDSSLPAHKRRSPPALPE